MTVVVKGKLKIDPNENVVFHLKQHKAVIKLVQCLHQPCKSLCHYRCLPLFPVESAAHLINKEK